MIKHNEQNKTDSISINKATSPSIFTKKTSKGKVISFNPISNTIGETRYYPPATREWSNSIYAYNNNTIKDLSVLDKVLTRIVRSYFNLSLPLKYLTKQYRKAKGLPFKRLNTRFTRLSLKKIFVGKAELRHTSTKVVITLFTYDGQRKFLERKANLLKRLNYSTNNFLKWLNSGTSKSMGKYLFGQRVSSVMDIKAKEEVSIIEMGVSSEDKRKSLLKALKTHTGMKTNLIIQNTLVLKREMFSNLNIIRKHIFDKNKVLDTSNLFLFVSDKLKSNLNPLNLAKPLQLTCGDNIKKIYRLKKKMHNALAPLISARTRLLINELKFSKFIVRLTPLIIRLYGKKVEFNIVKLQRMYFNGDIFTQAIAIKLKNRDNKLLNVMRSALFMAKVPRVNTMWKKLVNKKEFVFANKAKNLSLVSFNETLDSNLNKDYLNQMLMHILPVSTNNNPNTVNNSNGVRVTLHESDNRIEKLEGLDDLNNIYSTAFSRIKYKAMAGVRVEARGRLTRRLTASRAVFKVRWKGGLKNIDSSHRGLSAVVLRGHAKSNVEYSLVHSKTRNGAFGIKGWVSGL